MTVHRMLSEMPGPEFDEWAAMYRIWHGAPKTDEEMMQAILERRATAKLERRK